MKLMKCLSTKTANQLLFYPNKEFISKKALYFPFRSKSISNFKNQVNPKYQENVRNLDLKTEMKSKENVHAVIIVLDKSNALPSNPMGCATLRNSFTDINNSFVERTYLHKANALLH